MRRLLATARTFALLAWTDTLLAPCLLSSMLCGGAPPRRVVRLWHRGCCRIAGLQVRVRGTPAVGAPTLFVANHVSYLDIVVLGSLVDAGFVAKSEVAAWPLVGLLAASDGRCSSSAGPPTARGSATRWPDA
jgi:1-acyl-sn-glycerol-3-phosphate acyltransferase